MKNIFLPIFFLIVIAGFVFAQTSDEKTREMQEIYFQGRKFYDAGNYREAIDEFEKILKLSPGHSESLRMIELSRDKLELADNLIENALEDYQEGNITDALQALERALKKDSDNIRVQTLLAKILTEAGIEKNISGQYSQALEYLDRALEIDPENAEIAEFIEISRSMAASEMAETARDESEDVGRSENISRMFEVFEKYQSDQAELLSEYAKTQKTLQNILMSSEQEKKKMYEMLLKREEEIAKLLKEKEKPEKSFSKLFTENIRLFAGAAVILAAAAVFLSVKRRNYKKNIMESQQVFQEKIVDSFQKLSSGNSKLTDQEKKFKKLDIIAGELGHSSDIKEKQMALRMLGRFFKDPDSKVQMKALKILYMVNPSRAIQIIENIIKKGSPEKKEEVYKLIEETGTVKMAGFLLKLVDSPDDRVKQIACKSLLKIKGEPGTPEKLKSEIDNKLKKIADGEGWILS